MTHQTEPLALLRDTEHYLSALHGSVARHDNLAANYGCAGCELRDRIAAALLEITAAVSAAVAPPIQAAPSLRAGLRDEIVKALGRITTVPPVAHRREQADHVLAVLYREWPWLRAEAEDAEPTDHAAVLREAADRAEVVALRLRLKHDTGAANGACEVMDELRRMADETQQPGTDRRVEPIHCGLCLYGSDVGVPGYDDKGPAYTNPACPDHNTEATPGVCICGHTEQQHFEDVCQTCGCGDYLEPRDAAEVINRWRQAALKARADRAAVLTEPERKMLAFALEITQEEIHARSLDLADDDKAALVSLRRMADETATETPSMRLARQSVQAMTDTLQRACPPGCVACATDESHDPQPAAGARQDGTET